MEVDVNTLVEQISKHKQREREWWNKFNYKKLMDFVFYRIKIQRRLLSQRKELQKISLSKKTRSKSTWRDSGPQNNCFSHIPAIHGKILNYWEASRAAIPERNYIVPKGSSPMKYSNADSGFFPPVRKDLYPSEFQAKIETRLANYKDLLENPAKHGILKPLPKFLSRNMQNIITIKKGKEFGWGKHSTWENYSKLYKDQSLSTIEHKINYDGYNTIVNDMDNLL